MKDFEKKGIIYKKKRVSYRNMTDGNNGMIMVLDIICLTEEDWTNTIEKLIKPVRSTEESVHRLPIIFSRHLPNTTVRNLMRDHGVKYIWYESEDDISKGIIAISDKLLTL